MTRTLAWFHCFAGIAGDMALGSLVDAGADLDEVLRLLDRLPVGGWRVEAEEVLRSGLAATHVRVTVPGSTVVRTAAHITGLIEEARLPPRVRDRALSTFSALAEAEGRVHRKPAAHVHFHEVGALDAIVDIVGTCAALEVLEVDEVHASRVATGTGVVRTAHGLLPNPPPAVVELLRGVPIYGRDLPVELTTPTGAALLAALSAGYGPMPALAVAATGYGAGSREIEGMPNVTQVVLGHVVDAERPSQTLTLLEANVDDATGETLASAVTALIDAGAADAWLVPVVMKKGRPAFTVSALADPALAETVARTLTDETGSLGVRTTSVQRWATSRTIDRVDLVGGTVRVKVSAGRVKAEHDDAVAVARRTGTPVREVVRLAEAAWWTRSANPPDPGRPTDGQPGTGRAPDEGVPPALVLPAFRTAHEPEGPVPDGA